MIKIHWIHSMTLHWSFIIALLGLIPLPEILRSNLLALQSCHQISTQLKGYWWQQGQQSQRGAGRGGIRQIFEETWFDLFTASSTFPVNSFLWVLLKVQSFEFENWIKLDQTLGLLGASTKKTKSRHWWCKRWWIPQWPQSSLGWKMWWWPSRRQWMPRKRSSEMRMEEKIALSSVLQICLCWFVVTAIDIHDMQSYTVSLLSKRKVSPLTQRHRKKAHFEFPRHISHTKSKEGLLRGKICPTDSSNTTPVTTNRYSKTSEYLSHTNVSSVSSFKKLSSPKSFCPGT